MLPQNPQDKAAFTAPAAPSQQTQPVQPALPLTGVRLRTFQMFPEQGQQQLLSLVPCEDSYLLTHLTFGSIRPLGGV